MAHREEPKSPRARRTWNMEHAKQQQQDKAKQKTTPKKGSTRRVKGTGELQKWDGTKWLKYKEWKAAEKKAARTSVKDATEGPPDDKDQRLQQISKLDRVKIRKIENQENQKRRKKQALEAGRQERGENEWGPGGQPSASKQLAKQNQNQNKKNNETVKKQVEAKTQETPGQKADKIQKRINDQKNTPLMKRGGKRRQLEAKIRRLREEEKKRKGSSAYTPQVSVMGKGVKRFKGDKWIQDIRDLKVPNWVNEYTMFRSPSGAVDIDTVRSEYKSALDAWLRKGGDDLTDFRKKHGIIIDEKGNELLSSEWQGERRRFLREKDQTHSGKGGKSEAKQVPKEPSWNYLADKDGKPILNAKGKKVKFTKLEGHHVVGLAHLGPFFEGASEKQAFELRQRILNETRRKAVGTDKRNWAWLTNKQHDLAHKLYGYASDEEIADPKSKGLVFYDLEQQGKKGQPSLGKTEFPRSAEIRARIDKAPFDRPQIKTRIRNKFTGKVETRTADPRGIKQSNLLEDQKYATKGDYLIDYINTTDEAYESSIKQARAREPLTLPKHATGGYSILDKRGTKIAGPRIKIPGALDLGKTTGGLRRGEGLARFGAAVGTGDAIGATVAGGQLAIGEALKSSAAQKAIAKQVAELTAKRGAKTVAKMVPGLDILISGQETMQYLKEGKLDQAGIAALSGAIGWIPVVGDAGSAALDLTNTGLDISRLSIKKRKKKKPGTIGVPIKRRGTRIRSFQAL